MIVRSKQVSSLRFRYTDQGPEYSPHTVRISVCSSQHYKAPSLVLFDALLATEDNANDAWSTKRRG